MWMNPFQIRPPNWPSSFFCRRLLCVFLGKCTRKSLCSFAGSDGVVVDVMFVVVTEANVDAV